MSLVYNIQIYAISYPIITSERQLKNQVENQILFAFTKMRISLKLIVDKFLFLQKMSASVMSFLHQNSYNLTYQYEKRFAPAILKLEWDGF